MSFHELKEAEIICIKKDQQFSQDITALQDEKAADSSTLKKLRPGMSSNGLLVCYGCSTDKPM